MFLITCLVLALFILLVVSSWAFCWPTLSGPDGGWTGWTQCFPVKGHCCNSVLRGWPAEGERPEVPDLHIVRDSSIAGASVASHWHCPSFWWRVKFLFDGRISIHVMGNTHPPVSVVVGDLYPYSENDYEEQLYHQRCLMGYKGD